MLAKKQLSTDKIGVDVAFYKLENLHRKLRKQLLIAPILFIYKYCAINSAKSSHSEIHLSNS